MELGQSPLRSEPGYWKIENKDFKNFKEVESRHRIAVGGWWVILYRAMRGICSNYLQSAIEEPV